MTKRNLIIVHRGPEYEQDFDEIAAKVNARDRDITVYHLPANLRVELPISAWNHPTLTISLTPNFKLPVLRGPVLRNYAIDKLAQQEIFRMHGIATPPACRFRFGLKLDPILFSQFVIVKPGDLRLTSTGEGIRLMRRQRLESLAPSELDETHPLRPNPLNYIVQRFVDTGEYIRYNRVTSFFGIPLWCNEAVSETPRPSLASSDDILEAIPIANLAFGKRHYRFHSDPDVLSLAKLVHSALPSIPLLGIDILREEKTGKLLVLECNAGGNGWHFSSKAAASFREEIAVAHGHTGTASERFGRQVLMDQFDAFSGAADILVQKTRALAT
ncbi:hypothetical protein [Aestuariivirga sp.]|jgi:hypothetical protein|uniref:hypothetical protein n=1 Tax=Aestuariivirga sp. TaxID=2650926 RepID=UPI003784F1BA